jgi:plastocyanin
MRLIARLSLAFIVAGVLVGPGLGAQPAQAQASNRIVDFGFSPDNLTVDAGDVVEWTNTGARPHTFTDRGGTFDTGPIQPNSEGRATLATPGEYYFFCRINPGSMNGKITVRAGDEAPKAVRVQAVDPARDEQPLSFDPNEVEVAAGTPVILANVGGKPHTLTADDGSFTTGIVPPGAAGGKFAGSNASVVPSQPGDVPFHCDVHPEAMKGVLHVTGEARDGPTQGSSAPSEIKVDVQDFVFDPDEISVAPGGNVSWTNSGEANHTATILEVPGLDDVDEFDTGQIAPGATGEFPAPAQPGNYAYQCNVHPARMRGVLVVAAPGAPDPTQAQAGEAKEAASEGPGTGIGVLALATGVVGAFLGGFGVASFLRRSPKGPPG